MQVRAPDASDADALGALLAEMAAHYDEDARPATLAAATRALLAPAPPAGPFALVSEVEGGALTGLAVLCGFFPARDFTWGLLLKDLYVAQRARGTAAARALMTACAAFTQRHGYSRLDWTTDRTNGRARGFYGALGVPLAPKVFYRLEAEALAAAAAGAWPAPIPEDAR